LTYLLNSSKIASKERNIQMKQESSIDARYRNEFFGNHFTNHPKWKNSGKVWSFACPLCSSTQKQEWKKKKETACLIWNEPQNSWKFTCHRCSKTTNFYHFLHLVNPSLAARYQMDRFQAGTTGKGHDCPSPDLDFPKADSFGIPSPKCSQQDHPPTQQVPSAGSVSRLPRLTPQQQAGCQSGLNHLMRQREKRRREHEGW
jgi:hypothetical protein